jgi:chemotaxis protein MotA
MTVSIELETDSFSRLNLTAAAALGVAGVLVVGGYSLIGGTFGALFDPASSLIVAAVTAGGLLASCSPQAILAACRHAAGVCLARDSAPEDVIEPLLRGARIARRQGLISLEQSPAAQTDPFLADAIALAADGLASDAMRHVLDTQQRALRRRDEAPAAVFDIAAACAIRAGLLAATLVGLVALRAGAIDTVAATVGSALCGLAYGFGLATLLRPIATRIRQHAATTAATRELIADGVIGIRDGLAPRAIEQALRGRSAIQAAAPLGGPSLVALPRRVA